MGKKEKVGRKVVLDTNILVSALLFKSNLLKIVDLWKKGKIITVASRGTFGEFKDMLEYPKFSLTEDEIKTIMEDDVLPFFEIVKLTDNVSGVCKDQGDDKFLSCALSASADLIVSRDKDLCYLGRCKSVRILTASDFLKMFR